MSITEFATLRLKPPYTSSSSEVTQFFRRLSDRQSAWSGHPLLFFYNARNPSEVYLLSGWADVPAHHAWIGGSENQELLRLAEGILDVVELVHLGIDFRGFPKEVEDMMCSKSTDEGSAGGDEGGSVEDKGGVEAIAGEGGSWRLTGQNAEAHEETRYSFSDRVTDMGERPLCLRRLHL